MIVSPCPFRADYESERTRKRADAMSDGPDGSSDDMHGRTAVGRERHRPRRFKGAGEGSKQDL
jgi:hypothetical protein